MQAVPRHKAIAKRRRTMPTPLRRGSQKHRQRRSNRQRQSQSKHPTHHRQAGPRHQRQGTRPLRHHSWPMSKRKPALSRRNLMT